MGYTLRPSYFVPFAMSSQPLSQFSKRDARLADLTAAAQAILQLDRAFKRLLPGMLGQHCQVACFRDGELVVYAHNSTVAARLRMLGNSVVAPLTRQGYPVQTLRVKVLPTPPKPVRSKSFQLSDAGLDAFARAAGEIRNPVVKEALGKLLRHHRGSDKTS